jgi:hypothetical protein
MTITYTQPSPSANRDAATRTDVFFSSVLGPLSFISDLVTTLDGDKLVQERVVTANGYGITVTATDSRNVTKERYFHAHPWCPGHLREQVNVESSA